MINITGTYKEISMMLPMTTIGTCDYTARIFDVTGEVLHDVKAVNGIKLQWVTSSVSLLTITEDAINKIAELHPEPEPLQEVPIKINW